MELNEITEKLPPHLMQFVVDQPYNKYTAVDQAVWRYVMRKNYSHLTRVAHESYVDGLHKAGIEVDRIPTMYGMNRILRKIGWAAVAVDGFIPPGAFMEFTAYKVLVIAAAIRSLEHIEYTPAPDIIHESAGHAPIIADPDFARYLINIGKAGSKAFSSHKDYELYEAIRHLSIIKEDPNTPEAEIEEGEKKIAEIQANMGPPSEMALLRNLHWWTVEYGLIGTPQNFRIYGAGLLSSIGESESCLRPEVKKYPYTIDAAYCNYDITRPQPQLFVTPDFNHLTTVLNQFEAKMAFKTGGTEAVGKAIESGSTATCVFSSGLQVSGTFTQALTDKEGKIVYLSTTGPSALAYNDIELPGHGAYKHKAAFASPAGRIKGLNIAPEKLKEPDLYEAGIRKNNYSRVEMESGIVVSGVLTEIVAKENGELLLLGFNQGEISYENKIIHSKENGPCYIGIGEKIVSAFAGPADVFTFPQEVNVPREKTHKIKYDSRAIKLQKLYSMVREIRESNDNYFLLPKIAQIIHYYFPADWLLTLEILEILETNWPGNNLSKQYQGYLAELKRKYPQLAKLIDDGLKLIFEKRDVAEKSA